jgi:hypothetical protein
MRYRKPNRPDTASWYEDRLYTSPDHTPDTQHYYTNNAAGEVDLQAQVQDTARLLATNCTLYYVYTTFYSQHVTSMEQKLYHKTTQQIPHILHKTVRYRIHNITSMDPTSSQRRLILKIIFRIWLSSHYIIIIIIFSRT